jgi:hypothetical protein
MNSWLRRTLVDPFKNLNQIAKVGAGLEGGKSDLEMNSVLGR